VNSKHNALTEKRRTLETQKQNNVISSLLKSTTITTTYNSIF